MTAPAGCAGAVHKAPQEGGSCACGRVTRVVATRVPWKLSDELADVLALAVNGDDAHAVLWHYDSTPGVLEPGSFVQALVAAMDKADPRNLSRLAYGFPGHAAAVQLAKGHAGGIARLRQLAGLGEERP